MQNSAAEFLEAYRALRLTWLARLHADVNMLGQLVETLKSPADHSTKLEEIAHIAHRLVGNGQAFEAPDVSVLAREIEAVIRTAKPAISKRAHPSAAALSRLVETMAAAAAAAQHPVANRAEPVLPASASGPERRSLFVVDDDPVVAGEIALQLCHFGYRVRTFSDRRGFAAALALDPPALVVMDLVFPGTSVDGMKNLMESLPSGEVPPPVLFVSNRNDFEARLQAVRAGAAGYFTKPINLSALVDSIEALTNPDLATPLRVLIVDDDAPLAEAYGIALRAAGMTTAVVTDSRAVLAALLELRPDVVLLDLYLLGCTGEEVARVIRSDNANVGIPILFLSAEYDRDKQIDVMKSGADDFLIKPIAPEQLAREFLARAPRIRALQGHLSSDGLTGLLNHVAGRAGLERELARARRDHTPITVAMLDLDGFKGVNDRHGHPVGDRVLRSLAWLLRKRLRQSDVVGRYGGEEFLVILPNTPMHDAETVVDGLRRAFAEVRHASPKGDFVCTFSAGLASFPDFQTGGRLLDSADRALYDAKASGRNCIRKAQAQG